MSVTGLVNVPNSAMLHQPHQVRAVDSPGDRFALSVPFESFGFDRNVRIFLPPLEMVVEDMYIVLDLNFDDAGTAATFLASNTQTWLGSGGAQLLYKSQSLYTMSEAEALVHPYLNTENQMQMWRRLDNTGDHDTPADYRDYTSRNLAFLSLRLLEYLGSTMKPRLAHHLCAKTIRKRHF